MANKNFTKKIIRIVFGVFVILWCVLIFSFSAQPAEVSSETSGHFSRWLAGIFVKGFTNLDGTAQQEMIENMQFAIRKSAHFCIYLVLGFLVSIFLFDFKLKKRYIFCQLFCSLYAISDEIHQLFVSGRSGQVRDVLIDSCGAFLGINIAIFICFIIKKIFKPKV